MKNQRQRYRWQLNADGTWSTVNAHRSYTGSIAYDGVGTFTLTINPGAIVTTYATLKLAKNGYRVFLRDKS